MATESTEGQAPEHKRVADLHRLFPTGKLALDVGARDGALSIAMADRFEQVVALDLETPKISHPRIECQAGDAASLPFEPASFDFVLCAEVLEHVLPARLALACGELARVTRGQLLVGVPYRQDIRLGRATCSRCGTINPPWGHVNAFDLPRLNALFPNMTVVETSFVGTDRARTNRFSTSLMDYAGNPYGTYTQLEPCIECEEGLGAPPPRNVSQKFATRAAFAMGAIQRPFIRSKPKWVHVVFEPSHRRGR